MKNIITYLLAFALLGLVMPAFSQPPVLSPKNGGKSLDPDGLRNGDIIFSTTDHFVSAVIRAVVGGPISHVCVVEADPTKPRDPYIIEGIGAGVRRVHFSEWIKDQSVAVAFKVPNLSGDKAEKVIETMNFQLGKPYSRIGAIKSAPLCQYNQKLCAFFLGNNSKGTFCSKLVVDSYNEQGVSLGSHDGPWNPNDLVALTWFDQLQYLGHLKY